MRFTTFTELGPSASFLSLLSSLALSHIIREKPFSQPFPSHGQSLQVMKISWCSVVCCQCAPSWCKFLVRGLCCQPSGLSSLHVYCPILSKVRGKMESKVENEGHQGKIKHLCRPCSILPALSKLFTQLLNLAGNLENELKICWKTLETNLEGRECLESYWALVLPGSLNTIVTPGEKPEELLLSLTRSWDEKHRLPLVLGFGPGCWLFPACVMQLCV